MSLALGCGRSRAAADDSVRRIGVYDSRAVAVAWAGSPSFKAFMAPLMEEMAAARAAGDGKRVKELEAEAETRQRRLHMQGFSTAPVDDILDCLRERLPGLRQQAGVEPFVSKWDTAALARYPGAEQVDVTMALVDALQPTEKQRRAAVEIQGRKPIPLERARTIKDW